PTSCRPLARTRTGCRGRSSVSWTSTTPTTSPKRAPRAEPMAIRVAPLGAADVGPLASFACREDVVRFGDHLPDAQQATWRGWLGPPDPNLGLALGAFAGGQLEAALKVVPFTARRRVHGARLHLLASTDPQGDAPLDALLRAAFDSG